MGSLINFALHGIEIVLLVTLMRCATTKALLRIDRSLTNFMKKGGTFMGQIDDLKAAVESVATAEADVEQRIDTLIEALKMPHDSPEVGELIQQLENTRARLSQFHSETEISESKATKSNDFGG